MLLDFTLENWMSFRDPVTFTMNPDEENNSNYVLPRLADGSKILPFSVIYGGNASGKSNFVKSLAFARNFILRGIYPDEPIPINTFNLQDGYDKLPVKLSFTVVFEDKVYTYDFAVSYMNVVSESLYEHNGNEETCLYKIEFGKLISINSKFEHKKAIEYIIQLKRIDQLLLTTIANMTKIKLPVYTWFLNLSVFQPRFSYFGNILNKNKELRGHISDVFETIDCGIEKIEIVSNNQYKKVKSSGNTKTSTNKADDKLIGGQTTLEDAINDAISATGFDSKQKLVTLHRTFEGKLKQFELHEESDGTIRLLELIPVFIELSKKGSNSVFVIDEIENSLHTHLLSELIDAYLLNCYEDSRTQLIFTTHDVQIMDDIELLKDEIWFLERNEYGKSDLFSLGDFEDMDLSQSIRKKYLVGKLGGKPKLSLQSNLLREPKPKG